MALRCARHCLELGRWVDPQKRQNSGQTRVSCVESTTSAAVFAVAGDVVVAKHKAAGAVQDRKSVNPDLVHYVAYGHPLWKGTPELKMDGCVYYNLSIPESGWKAENVHYFGGLVVKYHKFVNYSMLVCVIYGSIGKILPKLFIGLSSVASQDLMNHSLNFVTTGAVILWLPRT